MVAAERKRMATVPLIPAAFSTNGLTATFTTPLSLSDTYVVQNNGKVVLHFRKSGAGPCTVTVVTNKTVGGLAVADYTPSVPGSTGDVYFGPYEPDLVNNANGQLAFTVSEVTGLSVQALQMV
jgi:hypothetical protein